MEFLELLVGLRTPVFDKLFLLITELGGEMAFIAISVIVFWCVSKRDGYLLLCVGFLGTVANQFFKISFRILIRNLKIFYFTEMPVPARRSLAIA